MRRVALALALMAILVPVALAAPKPKPVTNPLTADLDAGGYRITNVGALDVGTVFADHLVSNHLVSSGTTGIRGGYHMSDGIHAGGPSVQAGTENPNLRWPSDSAREIRAQPGSLYLRWHPDGHGEHWLATSADPGPRNTVWVCVAGCTP